MSVFAEAARTAGSDLIHRDALAQGVAADVLPGPDHFADELMAGNEGGLDPCGLGVVPPEHGRSMLTLQVAGTDAAALGPDQQIVGAAGGDGIVRLQTVVGGAVGHKSLHGFGQSSLCFHN